MTACRDDVEHKGERVDWGKWAITCDDPDFGGEGQTDTGEDYGPAPGTAARSWPLQAFQRPVRGQCIMHEQILVGL